MMFQNRQYSTTPWYKSILLFGVLATELLVSGNSASSTIFGLMIVIAYLVFCIFKTRVITIRPIIFIILLLVFDFITIASNKNIDSSNFLYYEIVKYIGLLFFISADRLYYNRTITLRAIFLLYLFINISCVVFLILKGFSRVSSFFGSSYNTVAAYNLIALPLIIYETLREEDRVINRGMLIVCQALMYFISIISGSRIALPLLAIIFIWEIFQIFKKKNSMTFLLLLLIPIVVYFLLQNQLVQSALLRLNGFTPNDLSEDLRMTQYTKAFEYWKNGNILFGSGSPKSYFAISGYAYAHNFILETLMFTGLVGLMFQITYYIKIVKHAFASIKRNDKLSFSVCVLTCLSYFGMGMLHPLISSSIMFNLIFAIALFTIARFNVDANCTEKITQWF